MKIQRDDLEVKALALQATNNNSIPILYVFNTTMNVPRTHS